MAVRAYGEDLASIHHADFNFHAAGAAPGLLALLRRAGIRSGRVVDLGSGSGIWARALVDAGYEVAGWDISPAMVRLARKEVPEGRFHVGSFLNARLPECAAATSLGECFNYLFDRGNGLPALKRLFRRIHAVLPPGGLLIFDVAAPGRGDAAPRQRHWVGDDWAMLATTEEDRRARLLTRRITTFRKAGRAWRRSDEVHRLRLYRPAEMAAALRAAGFRVRIIRAYGRYRLLPGLVGFVARKP